MYGDSRPDAYSPVIPFNISISLSSLSEIPGIVSSVALNTLSPLFATSLRKVNYSMSTTLFVPKIA